MAKSADDEIDIATVFGGSSTGGGKKPPPSGVLDGMDDDDESSESDLPPAFLTAFEEFESAESTEERATALKRAIEACKGEDY